MQPSTFPVQIHKRHYDAGIAPVSITPEISELLDRNAVVAIGISGGKDSHACAVATKKHLDEIGHTGPRVLVHSDLGRVEWKDSLPACERLAARLGMELLTVRRNAGDMMDRWQGRWRANVARYADLTCVKLILPWSTPALRFCTSELKGQVITSALKKRYPDHDIVNVTGIRREESPNRAKAPVSKLEPKLTRRGYAGYTWNSIIEYSLDDVLSAVAASEVDLHEGYTKYGMSRISCAYCIMSSEADLMAAAGCVDNQDIYIEMVELEVESTFAFQGSRWLGDVAPHLLPTSLRDQLVEAKEKAILRRQIEDRIPKHLLYVKGWPTAMVSMEEASLIADVRREVADLMNLKIACTTPAEVVARYSHLLLEKLQKDAQKTARQPKPLSMAEHDPALDDDEDVESVDEGFMCGMAP